MLVSCKSGNVLVPLVTDQPWVVETAYPVWNTEEPYPPGYPAPKEPTEAPTPTIDPTLGIVKGELYLRGEPVERALLFLSDVYQDNLGNDSVVSIDYNTKIRAITREDGAFTFVNIPLGRYALVIVEIPNSFLLLEPETQGAMVIVVSGNETISMGRLNYDDLPVK